MTVLSLARGAEGDGLNSKGNHHKTGEKGQGCAQRLGSLACGVRGGNAFGHGRQASSPHSRGLNRATVVTDTECHGTAPCRGSGDADPPWPDHGPSQGQCQATGKVRASTQRSTCFKIHGDGGGRLQQWTPIQNLRVAVSESPGGRGGTRDGDGHVHLGQGRCAGRDSLVHHPTHHHNGGGL